jgi:3-oxoacyl-[acyl-carrier-protein] synthase-3
VTRRFGPATGALVVGSATALPPDIDAGESLDNEQAYRRLLGGDAEATLATRGWRWSHPLDSWGVARRAWIVGEPEAAATAIADLAAHAASQALVDAGIDADDVDIVFAATSTPPRISSALAAAVGKRLRISAPCLDLRAGGAGALSAWVAATRFLSPECTTAVVVAVEAPSLYIDRDDLAGALLYGDAAAAVVLRHEPDAPGGLVAAVLGRFDGPGRAFTVPGPLPPTVDDVEAGRYRFQVPDRTYRDALADSWRAVCTELRAAAVDAGVSVSHLVPYAVTSQQVRDAAAAIGLADSAVCHTLRDHGCIGCAGPLAGFDALRRGGRADAGDVVALAAVAGGVSAAGVLWRV